MIALFSWLAFFFLTLAGYSAGAVLANRIGRSGQTAGDLSPSLFDTIMVIVVWIGGTTSKIAGVEPWLAIEIWVPVAIAASFLSNRIHPQVIEGRPLQQ